MFTYAIRKAVPSSKYTGCREKAEDKAGQAAAALTCDASIARSAGDRSEATTKRIAER